MLRQGLLRLADVVEEVDIALLERLRGLPKGGLLHAKLPHLTPKCPQARSNVTANIKLLPGQRTNALTNILKRPGLRAIDARSGLSDLRTLPCLCGEQVSDVLLNIRLLPCQCTRLGCEVAITLRGTRVDVRSGLTKLRLLHA